MNSTDLIGALAYDAMRIATAIQQTIGGAPLPEPQLLRELVESMLRKAQMYEAAINSATGSCATGEMKAELN